MTFDEACHIQNPHGIGYREKMDRYVAYIGRDEIRPHLPAPVNALAREYLMDRNFNKMRLSLWESAAGFPGFRDAQGQKAPIPSGPLPMLLYSRHVTSFSMSQAVSLLKHAAELDVIDYLKSIFMDPQADRPEQFWAVFEHCSSDPDRLNRHNIFDFDCVASFDTEVAAMAFEAENPEYRVRKLVTAPKRKNTNGPDNH